MKREKIFEEAAQETREQIWKDPNRNGEIWDVTDGGYEIHLNSGETVNWFEYETESVGYEDLGECEVTSANDANIPVSIWISPEEDDEGEPIKESYRLRASLYMPRKGHVVEDAFRARSSDRKVLEDLVRVYWLPLYQMAVKVLTEMKPDEDGVSSLYYWNEG
jgi:hypothetical protein